MRAVSILGVFRRLSPTGTYGTCWYSTIAFKRRLRQPLHTCMVQYVQDPGQRSWRGADRLSNTYVLCWERNIGEFPFALSKNAQATRQMNIELPRRCKPRVPLTRGEIRPSESRTWVCSCSTGQTTRLRKIRRYIYHRTSELFGAAEQ
jgi:hypothetical protein